MKTLTGFKGLLAAAVAAVGLAAFAENNPTITLDRVQQRYPWNGLVDIDFTVDLKGNDGNQYYVRLQAEVNEGGNIRTQTMGEFLDLTGLTNAVHGARRVTWNTALDYSGFLVKNAKVTAQLMRHDGDLSLTPYFCPWCYTVIDVSGGPTAKSYPHWNEYLENMEVSTNKFNTEEYKTNKIVLRRIQPGEFEIGTDDGADYEDVGDCDNGYDYEERHKVKLTKPYYIGMFEITRAQWRKVVAEPQGWESEAYVGTEGIVPMSKIGFENICGEDEFLDRLRKKSGLEDLNLPTEAQWENACRAGTTTSTYFGNNVSEDADLCKKYLWSKYLCSDGAVYHGVGLLLPNNWGLYDMLGNAAEGCLDTYEEELGSLLEGDYTDDDPLGGSGDYASLRGGSFDEELKWVRAAARKERRLKSVVYDHGGFRLARHTTTEPNQY